ncbi:MAG: DUF4238 domain-containing protein [Sphingobium sp.]|jgi:hypothetical protein|uniref:DUF4238 domain-containing protein n=1 Tax=Sphingobium sp. JS3065 TaxID=2970925 RepID=UPI000BCF8939|nr:DUF4238 domain-containing protein [Sphingobium sp. JS3065]MCI1271657.1 DUF4238 domain-containing protein [Sphingobium sp.]OYW24248.1 MAG: hypothetical protein B7Z43_00020 [Sphingomonas sp. 12-62-6]MCI1756222.1 DUF4238 domain-containing protein [Sphingobium sp.]MCI2053874.1 DUF4238 domain-containing protein [Sphingobium sp.]UZW56631.1 DUF4238 domain-containing protein [Sphingobium sp. JS3065]
MTSNDPHRHHYVPQFYLSQFACHDDENKVTTLAAYNGGDIVAERKSISRIGYEEKLHDYEFKGEKRSIEGTINDQIETPFTQGSTWRKVTSGRTAELDETDIEPLYGLIHHLQRRNLEALRFIEMEQARIRRHGFSADDTEEERAMHAALAAHPDAVRAFFHEGILQEAPYLDDAAELGMLVYRTGLRLRTSTNPVIAIGLPGEEAGRKRANGDAARAWWLPLTPHCGVVMTLGASFTGHSNAAIPDDSAQGLNRHYLVQLLQALSVRYVLAEDQHIESDLKWAGYRIEVRTNQGFRYRKPRD